ncbi:MAG TPA: PEP-CTERM sorting domain-containing protein [Burkholderiaceae bacterium]|nr:PEP-CTERM sorting domain-containing protein [Burkholderiaceae bacterium]
MAGAQYLYGAAAPVPEPQSFAMLLAGLGAIAGVIRRRRARPEIR